jgi:hypothetical protein
MISKDTAYQNITQLVERFDEQKESYKKADYNETLTRKDFIDPFFKALGWDIDNSQGYAEAYREVIHEDRVKIGSATKAPDYSFRLPGGKRLFFVEAKKPSVLVKNEIMPAYQVRRYAWSAKLPVSILTDFEEFAVYDCNKKPKPDDKASTGRIKYLTYSDYIKEFDFIWDTFSKERVLKGSFDKFVASDVGKKGTTTVDKDFLASLDEWRIQLAQNIALRNPAFNEDELNYAVQQTIDRIIFLRIAEDRGVEEYGRLKTTLKGDNYYHNLFDVFKEADSKYNSGLFDFKKDRLSALLQLDNKVLKAIFNELYYPVSPYEFSVLSVEILGSAYEQFLGKQIKLTDKHKASIEEKPEVRKAGGVYYTPQYIVDYIVEQTVGKLIEGKKPTDVEKIKIVDPACGSGSFLIGAYQRLLTWYGQYYKPKFDELSAIAGSNEYNNKQRNDAVKERNKLPLTPDGALTSALKKQILLNNIYGVDIDSQAVEVTKLSLLLKCMEGETQSSINAEMRFGERVLPTLDNNIKSGNSLIDLDFYDGEFDFEPGAEKKIKPFSWEKAFPEVFKNGGFDAVIGNPPYVLLTSDLFQKEVITYLSKYEVAQYKVDLYHLFIEKGMHILSKDGKLGLIIPSNWMTQQFTDKLRKFILSRSAIKEIFLFNYRVFDQADVYTEIVILENRFNQKNKIRLLSSSKENLNSPETHIEQQETFLNKNGYAIDFRSLTKEGQLANVIIQRNKKLEEVARASLGCQAYNSSKHTKSQIEQRVFHSDEKLSNEYLEELAGNDVSRYFIERKKGQWIKYGPWLHDYRSMDWLTGPRILVREISGKHPKRIQASFTDHTYCNYKTILNVSPSENTKFSMKYLCGILNSSLMSFLFGYVSNKIEMDSFPRISVGDLKKLPIKEIDFANKNENKVHGEIVKLVDSMLSLYKEKQQTTLVEKMESIQHRINYTDDKINQLVYQLYRLNEEEIKIIENS